MMSSLGAIWIPCGNNYMKKIGNNTKYQNKLLRSYTIYRLSCKLKSLVAWSNKNDKTISNKHQYKLNNKNKQLCMKGKCMIVIIQTISILKVYYYLKKLVTLYRKTYNYLDFYFKRNFT